jgi:phenylacetate-CoA ligase
MTLARPHGKWLKDILFRCYYISAFDITDSNLDLTLELIEKKRIKYLWGYPGSLYFLARRAIEKGWNQPLRSLVTWGDKLYPQYRRTIEQAFKARVFDTYGCGEGMQIAAQCGHLDRYHIHTLDVVVEFLDDECNPVPTDQPGNIVLTRLHAGPTPLVRYKVGDVGVKGQEQSCSCGRGFHLMESIQGRDTDIIITPSGNRLIVHFFTGILEHFSEIDSFQVVQETLESIILRVVPRKNFSKQVSDKAVSKLKEMGASDMNIIVELVEDIPLSSAAKRQFVVSKLGKSFKVE